MKTSISKTYRIPISPNGLVHGFCQKIEIFVPFRLMQKKHREEVFGDVLVKKTSPSRQ